MNKIPSLSAITTFIEVAEAGAFQQAAIRLNQSPSAVSKSIARLEGFLGVKLLHRTTRSVSITQEGERYLEVARRTLSELSDLGQEISGSGQAVSGRLTVSAPVVFGRIVLAPALKRFHDNWPDITVELSLTDRLVDPASEGIDVVIRSGDIDDSATLIGRQLLSSQLVVCAAPGYFDDAGRPGHPDDLPNHNCLNFRNPRTGRIFPWAFAINGRVRSQEFRGSLISDEGEAVVNAATTGLGISQMPRYMATKGLADGTLEEALEAYRPPATPITALYLNRHLVAPRIREFMNFVAGLNREDLAEET